MSNLKKRLAAAFGVLAAFGVAAGLYVQTQPASAEQHTVIVDRFGTLHTLDAKIAQQTLAARHGLSAHYDPLTRSTRSFSTELHNLKADLAPLARRHAELSAGLEALQAAADERGQAVELFKRQNSILRNSLYYLPLAAEQVTEEIEQAASNPADEAEPVKAISKLVQATLTQNLLSGQSETAKANRRLKEAEALTPRIPSQARERYRLLLAHAKTVVRVKNEVDPVIRRDVLAAPVSAKLTGLEQRYRRNFEAALQKASLYRTVLYAWSILLLIAVLVVAFKLRGLYARLERLVVERTQKLNETLQELWGEMELAKKIQTALVPHHFELKDCDVAAVMRPTAEVGGDYYDVFEVNGVEWVLIGDVSGHGVPAGLVMMMCQTSVHSVVASRPDIAPDELLATVNRTLTHNIQRLGEDKYMTISALRREPDGSFKVAGMHQDLLVYRSRSGRIEHLLAEGTWLGIASDIRALLPVRTVKLDPGDALLLYTDGITEARKDGQMLDIDGLKQTLLAHGQETPEKILDGILGKLEGYDVHDDVAVLIIKQREPTTALNHSAA